MAADEAGMAADKVVAPSEVELSYIASMSRRTVVDAYSVWTDLSDAEILCLESVVDQSAAVLDLGCGAGRVAMWLDGRFSRYLGVDASAPMIEAARKNCPELAFAHSDVLDLDSADEAWDTVLLMGNVLDFLHPEERRSTMLRNCCRWLRAGGSIVGSGHLTHSGLDRGYHEEDYHGSRVQNFRSSASEIVAEVESLGFEVSLLARDYRKQPAAWVYWVATRVSERRVQAANE